MRVLFFMDPFFDYEEKDRIYGRALVLKNNFKPNVLSRSPNIDVSICCLKEVSDIVRSKLSIFDFKRINFYPIASSAIKDVASRLNFNYSRLYNSSLTSSELDRFKEIFPKIMPDLILLWGFSGPYLQQIYPSAKIFTCEHSPLSRFLNDPDILFEPSFNTEDGYIQQLNTSLLTIKEAQELVDFKSNFVEYIGIDNNIQSNISSRYLFFPGHYQSLYYQKYSEYANDLELLSSVDRNLSDEFEIIYTPHPLMVNSIDLNKISNISDRIHILKSGLFTNEQCSILALYSSSFLLNSHSKFAYWGYLLNKTVIELDNFLTSKISQPKPLPFIKNIRFKVSEQQKSDVLLYQALTKSISCSAINSIDSYESVIEQLFSGVFIKNKQRSLSQLLAMLEYKKNPPQRKRSILSRLKRKLFGQI